MATLIACIKNDFVKNDGKCNIKIRLSHDRKVRYLKTPYYIEPGMVGRNGKVKSRHANYIELNAALTKLIDEYNSLLASLGPDYYARYSWGTIAASLGILQDTISHALGHMQNETTEGYINYDFNLIDQANVRVIQAITEKNRSG